ncbi:hypothetical protein [Paracoccus zhejiangensis]|uniref:Uncharacterized protein n=1 Tax=Paracoccus zhejiangensis TaxID=1077935 RepID=A0A2H5EVE0_9RHOB|nr:hypothetical protein [Paracoccus zhejiangensis]AUH63275.1 hypothetical protein CX676_03140 [Paracoccus zhejiangensis]
MTGVGVEVLGVIAVGIGAAAVLYALFHALRKAGVIPARWLLPAGIGLAMIAYSVWNDYAWYDRAVARLPTDASVLLTGEVSQPWAPWSYLFPITTRFAAIDPASIESNADATSRARIMLVERRGNTVVVPQDFDCAKRLIRPASGDWQAAGADDPAFRLVCGEGA